MESHVYGALRARLVDNKTFSVFKSVFLWRTYFWSGSYGGNRPPKSAWLWLPLATLDLGRFQLRQMLRKLRRNMAKSAKSEENELDARA
jgi:hypothetical protein